MKTWSSGCNLSSSLAGISSSPRSSMTIAASPASCRSPTATPQASNGSCIQKEYISRLPICRPDKCTSGAMDRLIAQGKITYVGSSNFPGWSIAQANERAAISQRLGIVSEQSLYNLIERRAELEVIPACIAYGVGLIIWSPLAGGLLAGASNAADGRRQSAEMQQQLEERSEQLQAFAALAAEIGQTPANLALAWLLHQPGVVSTIVGPGSTDQMTSMLDVPEIALDAQLLARLDELFPPCGPAPEAYAW